jgi:hypothetical protein
MNGCVGLAEKPAQRVFPIPQVKVAFLLALELHQFADLLERNVEAVLAERSQLLFDIGNGRLGGETQGVVDGQAHAIFPVWGERFNENDFSRFAKKSPRRWAFQRCPELANLSATPASTTRRQPPPELRPRNFRFQEIWVSLAC